MFSVSGKLRIQKEGTGTVSFSGENKGRIFYISNGTLEAEGIEIKNGNSEYGAGIYNRYGELKLFNSTVKNCYASTDGGGILIEGLKECIIRDSRIENNRAGRYGGGIMLAGNYDYSNTVAYPPRPEGASSVLLENSAVQNNMQPEWAEAFVLAKEQYGLK